MPTGLCLRDAPEISDTIKPWFTYIPPDTEANCADPNGLDPDKTGRAIAKDNCSSPQEIEIAWGDTIRPDPDPNICTYYIDRLWSAEDACGNRRTHPRPQIITVFDETPPDLTVPDNMIVECDGTGDVIDPNDPDSTDPGSNASQLQAWLDSAEALDICNDFTVTVEKSTVYNCCDTFVVTATWTAIDACGNDSVLGPKTFTVVDTTAPVFVQGTLVTPDPNDPNQPTCDFILPALDVFFEGEPNEPDPNDPNNPAPDPNIADDCCASDISLAWEDGEIREVDDCPWVKEKTRIWTATDGCNNVSTACQLIRFKDATAPVPYDPYDPNNPYDPNDPDACYPYLPLDPNDPSHLLPDVVVDGMPDCSEVDVNPPVPCFTDKCGVDPNIVCTRDDGRACDDTYPVGMTMLTWSVCDVYGTCSEYYQHVVVRDVSSPIWCHTPPACDVECGMFPAPEICGLAKAASACIADCGNLDYIDVWYVDREYCDPTAPLMVFPYPPGTLSLCRLWYAQSVVTDARIGPIYQMIEFTDTEPPEMDPNQEALADVVYATADPTLDPPGRCVPLDPNALEVSDNCGTPVVTWTRSDGLEPSTCFPCGETTVTWTASDGSPLSDDAIHTQTITIGCAVDTCELSVCLVEITTPVSSPVIRCLDVQFCPPGAPPISQEREFAFADLRCWPNPLDPNELIDYLHGDAEGAIVPLDSNMTTFGTMDVAVKDPFHTLWKSGMLEWSADCGPDDPHTPGQRLGGFQFVHEGCSDPNGGDTRNGYSPPAIGLISGDLDNDNDVDVLDYTAMVPFIGGPAPLGADTPCDSPLIPPPDGEDVHPDFTCDGQVQPIDFARIIAHLFESGDGPCGGTLFRSGPGTGVVTRISVAELRSIGLGHRAGADLNHDGWIDMTDIELFMQGVRPGDIPLPEVTPTPLEGRAGGAVPMTSPVRE